MPRSCLAFGLLLIVYCLSPLKAHAQADQTVYGDALANGWQDWSWSSRDFNATDYVHSGSKSAKVTYTAAWQGFYLHHSAFDSSLYTALSFWIHGGMVSGRNLVIQALLNDAAQPGVPLNSYLAGGAVAAGEWRQVTVPLSALQADHKSDLTGFWLQDASGGAQPSYYVDDITLVGAGAPDVVHVTVNANQVRRAVDARLFGLNTAVWDAAFNTPTTVSLLQASRTRVLRFPGGSTSNTYHWQTNMSEGNNFTWATSFDAFAGVARAIGAQAYISVNYGTGAAHEAAGWVQYSNVTKGYGFRYWEIGNENYGDWESDNHARPHDAFTYATLAQDYIAQMKAADPRIKVGVVVVTGEDSYANYTDHPAVNPRTNQTHNGWTPVLLATLKSLGVTPDFVIYHKYAQGPGQEDDAGLLGSAASWAADAADLRAQLNDYLGAAGYNVEIVCTENNSVYARPGKQTTSLVNGLFLADSTGQILQTELNALVWWDLRNGQETDHNNSPSLYGWRQYGDYGVVSPQNDLYPTYYVSKLLSHFARGGEQVVSAASDYNLLSAYAVRRSDGTLAVLVINKSPTGSLNANLTFNGYAPQPDATVYSYGVPQDEAARTGIGSPDVSTGTVGGVGSSFNYTFPAYSATVLSLAAATRPSFNDVPDTHQFSAEIRKIATLGITGGCGGGDYCPDSPVTREQMAIFIERALGVFAPTAPAAPSFNDVSAGRASYAFIEDFARRKITGGCAPGLYCPDDAVTREQMAVFIERALGVFTPPTPAGRTFNDVPPERFSYPFIEDFSHRGITSGCAPNLYCPFDVVTRGQMAAFLVRAFGW